MRKNTLTKPAEALTPGLLKYNLTFHIKVGELQESTAQEALKLEEIEVTNPQFKMKCPGKFRRVAERDKETSTPSN